jgi:hypothetical protein
MMAWERDKIEADRYMPEVKRLLAEYLLIEAPFEDDALKATDLKLIIAKDLRIAVRVRRPSYEKYWGEFTLRSRRDSGAKTEFKKVMEGFGDLFFYGLRSEDDGALAHWVICDLSKFRTWVWDTWNQNHMVVGFEQPNGDGTWFRAFRWMSDRSLTRQLIVPTEAILGHDGNPPPRRVFPTPRQPAGPENQQHFDFIE